MIDWLISGSELFIGYLIKEFLLNEQYLTLVLVVLKCFYVADTNCDI